MDQHPRIFLNFYVFTKLAVLDCVLQIFIFFRNQDQITPSAIVHLPFVLPNYGTISPLTLRTVVLNLPLRQHWKQYCIDFSCSFGLLFVAQWVAVWQILALYKFPYHYYLFLLFCKKCWQFWNRSANHANIWIGVRFPLKKNGLKSYVANTMLRVSSVLRFQTSLTNIQILLKGE